MQFLYHPDSGKDRVEIEGEEYRYLFKVRRHKKGEEVALRNLQDHNLYIYKIVEVDRKRALLTLVHFYEKPVVPKKFFHLYWCVIDPKTIEKTLPMLNELGVSKITFVYCDRSQKNFRLKLDKLQKILINSCQQCGRSSLMELDVQEDLKRILENESNIVIIDFSEEKLECGAHFTSVLIGPEGGFSEEERSLFSKFQVLGLDTDMILRSETAAVYVSSVIL